MTDTIRDNPELPVQDDAPKHGATTLLWVLLLLVLVAFGWWYFAHRNAGPAATGYDTTPIGGARQEAAAEAERNAPAGNRPARASTARRPASDVTATRTPATRNAELLAHAAPAYPREERQRGAEGSVILRIAVDPQGIPTDIGYASRSGNNALDRAALDAARDWRFRPATRNGTAVASTVDVPVDFRL